MQNLNSLSKFFQVSHNFMKYHKDEGKEKLRNLIGAELIKKRGEYWYWGILELKKMGSSEIEKLTLKIERNTPPFISDDFQIGYEGAFEN